MGSSLRILGVTEIKVPALLSSLMVRPLAHFIQLSIIRAIFTYCLYYSNLIFSAIPYCLKFPWFEIRNRNRPAFRTNDIQWYYFFTCCQKLSAAWTMNHSVFIISFIISHFHPNSRVFHYSPINITISPVYSPFSVLFNILSTYLAILSKKSRFSFQGILTTILLIFLVFIVIVRHITPSISSIIEYYFLL